MQQNVVWANPEDSVQQAIAAMQQKDTGYIIVGLDENIDGIVSKSDLTAALSPYLRPIFSKWHRPLDDATLQIKIKWIMSRPVNTIKPDTPLAAILENMCRLGQRAMPVIDDNGKVLGLVTAFDIFKLLLSNNSDISPVGQTLQAPALEQN
jgi:CBS-domain-containing membrane protein